MASEKPSRRTVRSPCSSGGKPWVWRSDGMAAILQVLKDSGRSSTFMVMHSPRNSYQILFLQLTTETRPHRRRKIRCSDVVSCRQRTPRFIFDALRLETRICGLYQEHLDVFESWAPLGSSRYHVYTPCLLEPELRINGDVANMQRVFCSPGRLVPSHRILEYKVCPPPILHRCRLQCF